MNLLRRTTRRYPGLGPDKTTVEFVRVPLSRRIEFSSAPRAAAAVVLICALAGSLSSCGVRLDSAPPAIASPPPSEVMRAETVTSAEQIASAARSLQGDPMAAQAGGAALLTSMEAGSSQHMERLGGIWTPPPRPTDSASADVDSTPAPEAATPAESLILLVDAFTQARADSAHAADADAAKLLVSIALWRASAAYQLGPFATHGDGSLPVALPTGGVDLTALGLATFEDIDDLIRGVDAAAFGYEVLAARSTDESQRTSWVTRADDLRDQAQVLAVAAGVDGTGSDPRSAVYDISGLIEADALNSIVAMESSLATLWINADVAPALRPLTVDAALASILLAHQVAPLAGLDSPAGVLPGLTMATAP